MLIFLMNAQNGLAKNHSTSVTSKKNGVTKINVKSEDANLPKKTLPFTQHEEPTKKTYVMKSEELAHIHHFHKERVKKLKRHHKKFWMLTKIILIICHLLVLACAYSHLTH